MTKILVNVTFAYQKTGSESKDLLAFNLLIYNQSRDNSRKFPKIWQQCKDEVNYCLSHLVTSSNQICYRQVIFYLFSSFCRHKEIFLSLFFRRINTNSIVTAKKLLVFVSMKLCFEIIFLRTILPHILCPFIILVRNQCNSWIFLSTSIIHILSFFPQYDLYETNAIFILLRLIV